MHSLHKEDAMLSAHIKRARFKNDHAQFLKMSQKDLIDLWKEMNTAFNLSIPQEHLHALESMHITGHTEVDKSVLMLCYSAGSISSSLKLSVHILDCLGKMLHFEHPCLRREEDLETFNIRDGTSTEREAGFFWISINNAPSEYQNCTSLINWVQSQDEYRMPTFELAQAMVAYPEMLLQINGIMGPQMGILGLSRDVLKPGNAYSGLLPTTAPGVGILATNQCRSADQLKRVQLKNFPESENLKNQGIICRLIRHLPTE